MTDKALPEKMRRATQRLEQLPSYAVEIVRDALQEAADVLNDKDRKIERQQCEINNLRDFIRGQANNALKMLDD